MNHAIRRAFLTVGDRQVHVRAVGSGPPALFIHSSPTNGSFVVPDMLAQADRYTCFAFDTPGFGLSDPLPLTEMTVADLADATAEAMAALGLPPVPVYGTHSGAAIALELGFRHPGRVTGLVLDGLPVFTAEELARFESIYFAPLIPDPLGGHLTATWTRFRDQTTWFPWYARHHSAHNEIDLNDPEAIHRWTEMFYAAAPHYRTAYRAAIHYSDAGLTAAAGVTVPTVFTATTTDMLHPHLERLPRRQGVEVVEIGRDGTAKHPLTARMFARFGGGMEAPVLPAALVSSARVRRQFTMDGLRPQLVRYAGDRAAPVTLLLHDAPGSGAILEPRMAELAKDYFVVVPDLPGSGDSAGLPAEAEIADYAAAMWRLLDAVDIRTVAIEGRGFGASLAVEMAASQSDRTRSLAVDGLLLPEPAERAALAARYAPPIVVEPDGAHWYRLWLRLRDSLVWWPWFDTRRAAYRRVAADFDAARLHAWTVEVMKQRDTTHHFVNAALRHDAGARLADIACQAVRIAEPLSALGAAYGAKLDALIGSGRGN